MLKKTAHWAVFKPFFSWYPKSNFYLVFLFSSFYYPIYHKTISLVKSGQWLRVQRRVNNNFWVLIEGKETVGTIGVVKENKEIARLKRFYLRKSWRGKGWGRKLFKKAIRFCKRKDYQTLIVETTQKNQEAIAFFKKAGFNLKKKKGISLYFSKELKA